MDFNDFPAARLLVEKVDILGDHSLQQTTGFQDSQNPMNHRRLLLLQAVDKILGGFIVIAWVFPEDFDVEDLFGVGGFIKPILAPKVADSGQGGYSGACKGYAVPGFLDECIEFFRLGIHGYKYNEQLWGRPRVKKMLKTEI